MKYPTSRSIWTRTSLNTQASILEPLLDKLEGVGYTMEEIANQFDISVEFLHWYYL